LLDANNIQYYMYYRRGNAGRWWATGRRLRTGPAR